MKSPRILAVIGTRPEAIKLAMVVRSMNARGSGLSARICATAQHRSLLDQMLKVFRLRTDFDLDLMRRNQNPTEVLSRALKALAPLLRREMPDMVLVQGDTTTALAGALAAFHLRIPVAHVEAGLRSFDLSRPYPEEMNRVLIDRVSALRLAPTRGALRNLEREGLAGGARVTGNTVVDALLWAAGIPHRPEDPALRRLPEGRKLILVTLHRRESFGAPLEAVFGGLLDTVRRRDDAVVIYPVHPNPSVSAPARRILRHERVRLCAPLSYLDFVWLLRRCRFLVTDSGGLQEEAPTFGKPVLVAREVTERPELIASGGGTLVGTDRTRVAREALRLLDDSAHYRRMSRGPNPFGDGRAAERVVRIIKTYLRKA